MIFVPIGHDRQRLRRLPVITTILIVATMVVFGLGRGVERRVEDDMEQALMEMWEIRIVHPGVKASPEVEELLTQAVPMGCLMGEAMESAQEMGLPQDPEVLRQAQERFDAVQARFQEARASLPSYRYGHVPRRGGILTLFTHVFLHGDAMHLLGNMLFLYLAGIALEDRWGRGLFPVFTLAAGAVAGLAHALAYASSGIPLIGASGAVAGMMGAFLVCFAHSRIKFWFFFFFVGTFEARALVVLPLWLGQQMLYAVLLPDAPVAFLAHVGGFLFGAATAYTLRASGLEDGLIRPAVARAAAGGMDPELARARSRLEEGDTARAELGYRAVLERRPHDLAALRGLCETARRLGRHRDLAERLALLLRTMVRSGQRQEAGALLLELREVDPERHLRPDEWLAAARCLDEAGDLRAGAEYERFAATHARHPQVPHALLRAAALAFQEGGREGRAMNLLRAAEAARPGDAGWRAQVREVARRYAATGTG